MGSTKGRDLTMEERVQRATQSLKTQGQRPFRVDLIEEAKRQWRLHFDSAPVAAMAAVTSIMRAQQILLTNLNAILRPFALTFPRYEALMVLLFSRQGALPLGKLGERLQVHPTSVTSIIDRLEKDGLVQRLPHETDRRTMLAMITTKGRRRAEKATGALHANDFAIAGLDEHDLDSLSALLQALRRASGDFEIDPDSTIAPQPEGFSAQP